MRVIGEMNVDSSTEHTNISFKMIVFEDDIIAFQIFDNDRTFNIVVSDNIHISWIKQVQKVEVSLKLLVNACIAHEIFGKLKEFLVIWINGSFCFLNFYQWSIQADLRNKFVVNFFFSFIY